MSLQYVAVSYLQHGSKGVQLFSSPGNSIAV